MARSYAKIATSIWRDDDFKVLSAAEQHAYLLLITQPDISAAGVLTMALARWASRAKDCTRASFREALDGLQDHRFVVIDDETDELLVRSFVRWDGGSTNSKRRHAIRDAAEQIESNAIRRVLAAEFDRLDLPAEWVPAFPQVDSLSIGHTGFEDTASDAASRSRRVVVTSSSTEGAATHKPQTTTRIPSAQAPERKRASRIPDDFAVTAEMVAWANEHTPGVDGRYETAKFVDYWRAKSGRDATKLDWIGTWRNWMRNASERAGPSPVHRTVTAPPYLNRSPWHSRRDHAADTVTAAMERQAAKRLAHQARLASGETP
jgi:hypothetical protein